MKPIKLYEALFILNKCNQTINRLWKLIENSQGRIKEVEDFAILFTYYIKMETVSFLEEFNKGFYNETEQQFKQRVDEIRKISAPIIKRINKWKDLERFRNNIIAHPWRHKRQFVVPDQNDYNVPRNWFEIGVLVNLNNYVWAMLQAEFDVELKEAMIYMATKIPPKRPPSDYSQLNQDHLHMADEVEEVCKQLNKKYFLKVIQYIFPGNDIDDPSKE
ncbi:MAG: hypothetical protein ACRYGB_04435 [Janthinobacterium lividum]